MSIRPSPRIAPFPPNVKSIHATPHEAGVSYSIRYLAGGWSKGCDLRRMHSDLHGVVEGLVCWKAEWQIFHLLKAIRQMVRSRKSECLVGREMEEARHEHGCRRGIFSFLGV